MTEINYWWDLAGENDVIVETDRSDHPVAITFSYDPNEGEEVPEALKETFGEEFTCKMGYATPAIDNAEEFIAAITIKSPSEQNDFLEMSIPEKRAYIENELGISL